MTGSLEKAIDIIVRVARPDKVILFGSRARGGAKPESDYDLLILKTGIKKRRELAHRIYLKFKNIGASVDIVVVDTKRYERLKDDPYLIYIEATKNGRVVYEKS